MRRPNRAVLVTTAAPTQLPIDLEQAKLHLRETLDDNDELIQQFIIPSAASTTEQFLNRRLMPQTVELRMDAFPSSGFKLLADPIRSIESVKYDDENDAEQTLATSVYESDLTEFSAWMQLKDGQQWPSTYPKLHAVRIAMEVGWADAESIPADIRYAMLMLIGHLYENRELIITGTIVAQVPMAYEALLWPHRIVPV